MDMTRLAATVTAQALLLQQLHRIADHAGVTAQQHLAGVGRASLLSYRVYAVIQEEISASVCAASPKCISLTNGNSFSAIRFTQLYKP